MKFSSTFQYQAVWPLPQAILVLQAEVFMTTGWVYGEL